MSNKNLDTLITEALDNIRNDRKVAREFLNEIANQIANDSEQNKYLSPVAAKHIETLQRSNEQLVKIISLTQKNTTQNLSLTEEDKNNFESSMAAYVKGNTVRSKQVPWDSKGFSLECDEIIEFFSDDVFEKLQGVGDKNSDPIFVVGLPRSGSTLIEQILSSHSLVEGTTELQNIIALSRKIANKNNSNSKSEYPSALERMKKSEFKKMGSAYIRNTLDQRAVSYTHLTLPTKA